MFCLFENWSSGQFLRQKLSPMPRKICRKSMPNQNSSNETSHDSHGSTTVNIVIENLSNCQTTTTSSSRGEGNNLLQTATAIARNEDGTKSAAIKILYSVWQQQKLKQYSSTPLVKGNFVNRDVML